MGPRPSKEVRADSGRTPSAAEPAEESAVPPGVPLLGPFFFHALLTNTRMRMCRAGKIDPPAAQAEATPPHEARTARPGEGPPFKRPPRTRTTELPAGVPSAFPEPARPPDNGAWAYV